MVAFHGHYDGKVIVPTGPVDLPRNRELLLHVDSEKAAARPGVSGDSLLRFAGSIEAADLELMSKVIAEGCEQVGHDEW